VKDADLVRQAQQGDVNAVGVLYDRHHLHIYRYLWSRVQDPQAAEDLTGEVFARMVTALPRYRLRKTPFRAWLYRIAHNLMVDHIRQHGQRHLVPLYDGENTRAEGQDPATMIEQHMTIERVKDALNEIDPAQQEVVILRFLVGLPLKEVSAATNKSVAAVKSLQHRGLKALRAALVEA
jgi:RNA polymerase sigma-70 factor (ECF subfamily)